MRKSLTAILPLGVFLVLFCLVNPSQASPPSLVGVWKGTAPKITPQGCSNESVTINIAPQCGNLISGSITFGSNHSEIVGRISQDVNLSFHAFEMGPPVISVTATGQYVAGTAPQILIDVSYFYDTINYANL